ncbi:uncharacterized protein LOC128986814 [Macrosteles quadrilineatus]|uniref:uncharacterized protein LOC128986814 n=1 Tax=Macrosteles quadrilineatus TaxID=74068 RepID=UPI0023E2A3E3|nr:uncharacterized protein LOC128986814 [Macrosteles quadrilineatus]
MKCFITLIIITNLSFEVACLNTDTQNVKTSLFTELDIRRSCWSHDSINLLRARMIMQDLIPNKVPKDLPYLVEYIRSTEDAVVKHSPEGKVRRIMMLALTDVLGGYLQSVVIPIAKEAYYAGNIDYPTMSRLDEMLQEMKARLRTDGGRWSRPLDMSKFATKVTQLHLANLNPDLACKALVVVPADQCAPGRPRISIPYLDYDVKPGAIALPLRARNLYSLKTPASSHIIVRFYILARECLSQMKPSETDIFNSHFILWLTARVVPHLYEESWYPGFGGVMRILETVNETSVLQYNQMPMTYNNDSYLEGQIQNPKSVGMFYYLKNLLRFHPYFVALIVSLLLLLLLACCCFIVCLARCRKGGGLGGKSSSGILNAVLSIYCGVKDKNDENKNPTRSSEGSYNYFHPYPQPGHKSIPYTSTASSLASSSDDEESDSSR